MSGFRMDFPQDAYEGFVGALEFFCAKSYIVLLGSEKVELVGVIYLDGYEALSFRRLNADCSYKGGISTRTIDENFPPVTILP